MNATAYHESGHAVVARVRGVAIERVAIAPASGVCRTSLALGALETADTLVFLAAGASAEAKHRGCPVAMEGDDLDQALAVAGLLTRDGQAPEDVLARYRTLADAEVTTVFAAREGVPTIVTLDVGAKRCVVSSERAGP